MDYITRISYNSAHWRQPTGDARKYESKSSYNHMFGFGHEDWLFRDDWQIDGWRYGFLQGVGSSLKKLRRDAEPFGVRLFCIEPEGKRRYVADIDAVECLTEEGSDAALEQFRRRGWLAVMKSEVRAVKGKVEALGDIEYAAHVLNIRFRPGSVLLHPQGVYAKKDDPVLAFSRYTLIGLEGVRERYRSQWAGKRGLPTSLIPFGREQRGSEAGVAEDIEEVNNRTDIGATTKETLIDARVGQGRFRELLLRKWGNACAVTGCSVLRAVRASHALRWADSSDEERLDANNGLPLIGTLDALFDAALIAFDADGSMLVSAKLSPQDRRVLRIPAKLRKTPSAKLGRFLQLHRERYFLG